MFIFTDIQVTKVPYICCTSVPGCQMSIRFATGNPFECQGILTQVHQVHQTQGQYIFLLLRSPSPYYNLFRLKANPFRVTGHFKAIAANDPK